MTLPNHIKRGLGAVVVIAATALPSQAAPISVHDLLGSGGTSLAVTTVAPGFTVTPMTAVGAIAPAAGLNNHFYFTGWDTTLATNKYLTVSVQGGSYVIDHVTFSVESTSTVASTVSVRTSRDGFINTVDSFTWGDPDTSVTNGTLNLGLTGLTGWTELRFYFTAPNTGTFVGFANHQPPGAGAGFPDVGQDFTINADPTAVPEPASMLLIGTGLLGLAVRRFRRK